jgi:hypothetical protein
VSTLCDCTISISLTSLSLFIYGFPLTNFSFFCYRNSSFTETDYLETYAEDPSSIYGNSEIDSAMSNAYMQTRKFLMTQYGITEAEANTIITQGVDFAITQVVDGNWGVHSAIPKKIFEPYREGGNSAAGFELVGEDAEAEKRSVTSSLVDPDLPLNSKNVHWGYVSKELDPVLNVTSGQEVVVEMAAHHACDDWDRMIAGDKGKMQFNGVVWMQVYVVRH